MSSFFRKRFWGYGIFWSWNFIFLILLIFVQVETNFLPIIIKNAFVGYAPIDFSIYTLLIFLIPLGSIVLGFTLLAKKPNQLLKLFYGVEIPLTLLFILRLGVFRELTGSTTHLFIMLALGMISYLSEILFLEKKTPEWLKLAQKFGHSLLLIIGLYIGVVLMFFLLPIFGGIFEVIGNMSLRDLQGGFFILLGILFFFYTATVIAILPIALVLLYVKAFIWNFKVIIPNGRVIMYSTILLNIVLLITLNASQPQVYAFEFLEKDFNEVDNRKELIKKADKLKEGLLNSYLASYRYLGSTERSGQIKKMYKSEVNFGDASATVVQNWFNFFASPFLYEGDLNQDKYKARELYEKHFDGSIQKNETEEIVKSMSATWDSDDVEAGILNVNQEKVHIKKQEITITEDKDIAEIEVYEIYENMTFQRQEIFYYFNLPPNSVITGLWLSDEYESEKKYPFRVSPRGAAQKVYKAEVRRRVDPSLLEQVGPNQYRLRAFPIPQRIRDYNYDGSRISYDFINGDDFHLWFSYKTMITEENTFRLPELLEKRNVYWTSKTELSINGESVNKNDEWLPQEIKSEYKSGLSEHIVCLNGENTVRIQPTEIEQNPDIKNKKLAFLIDGSFSMGDEKDNLLGFFEELESSDFTIANSKCYLINDKFEEFNYDDFISKLDDDEILFFGSTNYMDMLNKFYVNNSDKPDGFVILSDKGNYESSSDTIGAFELNSPLFIIHVGEEKAPIYNDALLETIQNCNGGILLNIDELEDYYNLQSEEYKDVLSYEDGILFSLINDGIEHSDPAFNELSSKVYISNLKIETGENRVSQLDSIHNLAMIHEIVTKYSSMIVLVNDRQKDALNAAEKETDRFDREVESGNEMISTPFNMFDVSGTPEPHEWILIGLTLILLFVFRRYSTNNILQ